MQNLIQDIFDNIHAAIWSFEKETNQLIVSAGFEQVYGYTREDCRHNPKLWQEAIYEEDIQVLLEHMTKLDSGQSSTIEHRIVTKAGEIRWIHCVCTSVVDTDRNVLKINGIVLDITEKKMAEEELVKNRLRLQYIMNTVDAAIWSYDAASCKMSYVSEELSKITGYPCEMFIDKNSWQDIIHPADLPIFETISVNVRQGIPEIIAYRIICANDEIRWIQNKIIPTMDGSHMTRIDGVIIDITSHKKMEKALAGKEAVYRLIADHSTDLLCVLDLDGTIRYASPSYKKVLGYDNACLVGASGLDFIHPEEITYLQEQLLVTLQTGSDIQVRYRMIHANGHAVYVESLGSLVTGDDGKADSIVVVSRDITEKVRADRELKASEKRYTRLIEFSPQPIVLHRDGEVLSINSAGVRFLGGTHANDVIGKQIFDFFHPDYVDIAKKRSKILKEKKHIEAIEYQIKRLDGGEVEAEVTGIYDDKTQCNLAFFADITERKKIERALRESEERYRRMVELSPAAISIMKDDQFIYVNPAGMHTLGAVQQEDIIGTPPLDWIHPDDRQHARQLLESTMRTGYYSSRELKMMRLGGEVCDVAITSIYDFQSSTIELQFYDITARKQAEQALMESEELNRCLVELSPGAVIIHEDYKYHYVNPAGLSLLGASSLKDIIGKSIFDNIHTDDEEKAALRLNNVYKQSCTSPLVEQKIVRMDGTIMDVEVIATSFPYKGKNAGLTLLQDITERKKVEDDRKHAEQIIRESEERYYLLQTSLDRFSYELFDDMKVSEVERRLIKEVREVTKAEKVSIIQVDRNNNVVVTNGNDSISSKLMQEIIELNPKDLPLCEIIEMPDIYLVKIGEIRGKGYLLCIGEQTSNLKITAKIVWLKTITRYVSVLYDNFRIIEDLTKELGQLASHKVAPSWLLRLLFNLSENERKRLSQDLHDAALQEQIIWYRRLDQISTDLSIPENFREQLRQVTQGLLDVIYQIRITCNELRPPLLKEEGIVSSLEALFDFTQMRTNFCIHFDADDFHQPLTDDLLIGVYRIVQELVANAGKHSNATRVHVELSSQPDKILLSYKDNGIGMDLSRMDDSFNSMGVCGMKERVRSMDGSIDFQSTPNNGLVVFILIPLHQTTTKY